MTDDEIRQIFNMIDKDKSGKLSLRVTNYFLWMVVIVFVVGVVYDIVDKFWQIIDMIGKEEERQAVPVHVVFMLFMVFMVLTRSARSLPRSVSSRVFTDLMGCHFFENWHSLKKEIFYTVVSVYGLL